MIKRSLIDFVTLLNYVLSPRELLHLLAGDKENNSNWLKGTLRN